MRKIYWWICSFIGYTITLRDWYCPKKFTLVKKNTHLSLYKHISKVDAYGHIRIKEIFTIQIKRL